MSEQSIREHHIGEPWLGMLSTILTEAGLGSEVQAFLYSKDVIGAPDLEEVAIIRANGVKIPIRSPGAAVTLNPGDSIRMRDQIVRFT